MIPWRCNDVASCRGRGSGCPAWYKLKIRVGTIRFFRSFQRRSSLTVFLPLPFSPIVHFAIEPEPIHLKSAARPSSIIVRLLEHKAGTLLSSAVPEVTAAVVVAVVGHT